ncbi:MAG: glycoside hydrolase family 57 protein [Bacteroidetes bacterium]|nr:glycoside hydrolase family 57 protein [Bacteroidota bacterium]
MKKLKIAILWHQHQPYYKYKNEYLLPWVRLHGVKDYYDLPALMHDYPSVKQTINLAPSLMMQIDDYVNNVTSDKVQRLTRISARHLTDNDKKEILNGFFTINYDNLLKPNERYEELFNMCSDRQKALEQMNISDWRDLQVWYNLAWLGQISKTFPFAKRLFKKQRDFTEEDKLLLLDFHNEILSKIGKEMANLKQLGQIDISCSPLHHPILPLLCDTNSALESMPDAALPDPNYSYPEDAKAQIKDGIGYYKKLFGMRPKGMWPSEGSVSNQTLELIAGEGIEWIASDEGILEASLGDTYNSVYKYFPHEINTQKGTITMFFRDHNLSDKIGFLYSNWYGYDAACNFREELLSIRNNIIHNLGEDALDSAVVPIILDGENCWEFYYENGIHFLRELFSMFENTNELETTLFSECLNLPIPDFLPQLNNVKAGSWINADFSIWIGHQDDIKAWNMLSKVRQLVDDSKYKLTAEELENVMNEIYIAEGSDWFWWYGPEHNAPNKPDFDIIFRWRIAEIYKMLGAEPPADLFIPISAATNNSATTFSTMHQYGK